MRYYVGTSGWMYDWNPDGFNWYVRYSNLNAVELNASFYRIPFRTQVRGWRRRTPEGFRWAVKVTRLITHVHRFGGRAWERWEWFSDVFHELDPFVDFYLFQLPPTARPTDYFVDKLRHFIERCELGPRFALEWRHQEWFTERWIRWCEDLGVTLVSVDCPDLPNTVFRTSDAVYMRMHGRTIWYGHEYSEEEIQEVLERCLTARPSRLYIFYNNDHAMLSNARTTLQMLEQRVGRRRTRKRTLLEG